MAWQKFGARTQFASADEALSQARELFNTNHDDDALRIFEGIDSLAPTREQRWSAQRYAGLLYYRKGQYSRARRIAIDILGETQEGYYAGHAHFLLGLCAQEEARNLPQTQGCLPETAIAEFDIALGMLNDPESRTSIVPAKAAAFADAGHADEAIAMLDDELRHTAAETHEAGWLYASIGEILAQDQGLYQQSIPYLEHAANLLDQLFVIHSWVHSLLALAYNQCGEFDKALAPAERAVQLAEHDAAIQRFAHVRAHLQLGIALTYATTDLTRAEHEIRTAMQLGKKRQATIAECHLRLGEVLRKQGKKRESVPEYEEALKLDAGLAAYAGFLVNAGIAAYDTYAYQKAVSFLQQYITSRHAEPEGLIIANFYLGQALLQLRRPEEAKEVFRNGLAITPPDNPYYGDMARALVTINSLRRSS